MKRLFCPTPIFCLVLFLLISHVLHGQDTLLRKDGTKQIVKILEVNEAQVKYKAIANLSGPTYVISKDALAKIVYENGSFDVFQERKSGNMIPSRNEDPISTDFGRNFMSLNIPDLVFGSLTFCYERTSKSGDFSFKIPLSLGLISLGLADRNYNDDKGYYGRSKIYSTGLDFYFYPSGQGTAKFFFGPSFEYGRFNHGSYTYFSTPNPPYYYSYFENRKENYYAFLLQNGVLFQPLKHFNISINAGLGYSHSSTDRSDLVVRGGLNIGYKY